MKKLLIVECVSSNARGHATDLDLYDFNNLFVAGLLQCHESRGCLIIDQTAG